MHICAKKNHTELAQLLIGHNINIDAKKKYGVLYTSSPRLKPRQSACQLSLSPPFTPFPRNGAAALHIAAEEDHIEMAQLLLEHGANVTDTKE